MASGPSALHATEPHMNVPSFEPRMSYSLTSLSSSLKMASGPSALHATEPHMNVHSFERGMPYSLTSLSSSSKMASGSATLHATEPHIIVQTPLTSKLYGDSSSRRRNAHKAPSAIRDGTPFIAIKSRALASPTMPPRA